MEYIDPKHQHREDQATGFRRAPLAHALPVLTATTLRHLHRAHAACIAAPHAPCRCVAHSLCCVCENNGSGTPRPRASAPSGCAPPACPSAAPLPEQPAGGFRLAAGGASSATPISLRGHRCKAASGAARIAAQHAASIPWVAPPPGLLMLAAVRPAAALRGALWADHELSGDILVDQTGN